MILHVFDLLNVVWGVGRTIAKNIFNQDVCDDITICIGCIFLPFQNYAVLLDSKCKHRFDMREHVSKDFKRFPSPVTW